MNYQLFRYYLAPTQVSLLSDPKYNSLSKQEIMSRVLSEKFDFENRGSSFAYRFKKRLTPDFIIANIGKKTLVEHDLKENDKFVSVDKEEWPFINLIMNICGEVQIFALEINKTKIINSPYFVLLNFSNKVNEKLKEYGWTIRVEPIIDEQKFWDVINAHQGKIKSIKFTYYVPNLFGVHDKLNEELDTLKNVYSAQKAETEITNDDGNLIIPDSSFVKESVEHISNGGGKYSIAIKGYKNRIKSESEFKLVDIDSAKLEGEDKDSVIKMLKELLK